MVQIPGEIPGGTMPRDTGRYRVKQTGFTGYRQVALMESAILSRLGLTAIAARGGRSKRHFWELCPYGQAQCFNWPGKEYMNEI